MKRGFVLRKFAEPLAPSFDFSPAVPTASVMRPAASKGPLAEWYKPGPRAELSYLVLSVWRGAFDASSLIGTNVRSHFRPCVPAHASVRAWVGG